MRKLSMVAVSGLIASLALTGCGKSSSTNSGGSSDVCTGFSGSGPKVGLAFDVGGRGDHSFNDSAYAGITKAVSQLGVSCVEGAATTGESDSARANRLTLMAQKGATDIIGVGFSYSNAIATVAPNFPKVHFLVIDGFNPGTKQPANVQYASFAAEQSSYLVGIAAAKETKTKQVGFVGGENIPLIQGFQAGFAAGVHSIDSSIKVDVGYIEQADPSGFNDPAKGKTIAAGQYSSGADVVYHAAGASGSGVFDAAVAAGKWAIGVDSDQYLTATPQQQSHILTSALKNVDVAVFDFLQQEKAGKFVDGYVAFNLKNGGVGYSTSGGFIDGFKADIDAAAAKIAAGTITVPTKP